MERHKERLVTFDNHQKEGIAYNETFAPVIKVVTMWTFVDVAATMQWELHQMDVHNTFLHGDLQELLHMNKPPGFNVQHFDMVCRL